MAIGWNPAESDESNPTDIRFLVNHDQDEISLGQLVSIIWTSYLFLECTQSNFIISNAFTIKITETVARLPMHTHLIYLFTTYERRSWLQFVKNHGIKYNDSPYTLFLFLKILCFQFNAFSSIIVSCLWIYMKCDVYIHNRVILKACLRLCWEIELLKSKWAF